MNVADLTVRFAQTHQPWTVPYSAAMLEAVDNGMPHLMGSHITLHAAKSVGKLAAVFERLDHSGEPDARVHEKKVIMDMAADLMTAALRLANLYHFDLAEQLVARVEDKNGVNILNPDPVPAK